MSLASVLVINCGSSSVKFSVIPLADDRPLLSGLAERLGIDRATMTFSDRDGNKSVIALEEASHLRALEALFAKLREQQLLKTIVAIGHRVAHGGSDFKRSVLITEAVTEKIRALSTLAPLHNPANLTGIEAARALLPTLPHIAVFDTAFHQTLSPAAYTYAIPLEYQRDYQVRRYGFHGTSHRYIAAQSLQMLDLPPADHGIVIAHLGNGSSLCAVQNGESVDTSMGMTPLEGLVMGTRCGDIDFGAVACLASRTGHSIDTLYDMLNNRSGLMGISGLSSDCRTLQQARERGHQPSRLAIDVMVHRLARHIGGHVTALKRFDALIFTGGIGENSVLIRELTVKRLRSLGLALDEARNQQLSGGRSGLISAAGTTQIAVIPTNEEKMIAIDAAEIARSA